MLDPLGFVLPDTKNLIPINYEKIENKLIPERIVRLSKYQYRKLNPLNM